MFPKKALVLSISSDMGFNVKLMKNSKNKSALHQPSTAMCSSLFDIFKITSHKACACV